MPLLHLAVLEAQPTGGGLRWIDGLGLGLAVLFLVFGAMRGLWWQIVRLLGIVAVVAVARAIAPRFGTILASTFAGLSPRLANGIAWLLVVVAGLLAVSMVARLGKKTIEAAELGAVDRVGGAVAGLASGVLLHAAILVCLAQVGSTAWASSTLSGTRSQTLLEVVHDRFPMVLDAHAAESIREMREAREGEKAPSGHAPGRTGI